MILYHYTALEHLRAIMKEGLSKGDVPTLPNGGVNAVWLTTDEDPSGHGLSDGTEKVTDEDRQWYFRWRGKMLPEDARFANKRAVRIKVRIPSHDLRLKHWPAWARKRLNPEWYRGLNQTGGGKTHTWYLYFGTIPASDFLAVDVAAAEGKAA